MGSSPTVRTNAAGAGHPLGSFEGGHHEPSRRADDRSQPGANTVGLGGRKGRGQRLAYVIIEAAKASGLIQRAIDDAGLRGVRMAAPLKPE